MAFPTTLSNYVTGAGSATLATAGHAANHNALEAKVGVDGSAVTSSLDYKINHLLVANITDLTASATELNYSTGVTSAIQTQLNTLTASDALKAPLSSPTFTGTVTLPVALSGIAKLTSGVVSAVTAPSGAIVGTTDTQTLTNKRVTPKILSAASYTTNTGTSLNCDTVDEFIITAQDGALKFNNPGGTPVEGQKLIIRIKDNATPSALTYDTYFRAIGVTLPTTTVASKTTYLGLIFNITDTKWDCLAVGQES